MKEEFVEVLPLVLAYYRSGYTIKNAWKAALMQGQGKQCRRKYSSLRHVLARWQCWGGSSGGVERLFSLWMKASVWRTVLSEANTLDVLMILAADKEDHDDIAELAQQIWLEVFSNARGPYVLSNIQKKRAAPADTEKAFISCRRQALATFVASDAVRVPVDKFLKNGPMWTKTHVPEHDFNMNKQAKNMQGAFEENGLLPDETYPDLADDVKAMHEMEHRQDVERSKRNARMTMQESSSQLVALAGRTVFVCQHCNFPRELLDRRLSFWKMVETCSLAAADVYVSPSATSASDAVKLAVALKGGIVMNSTWFEQGSKCDGAATLAYLPTVTLQRWVYMSKSFLATEPQKSKIILDVLEQVGKKKKWKLVKLTELQRRAAAKQCSALAFVTERIAAL